MMLGTKVALVWSPVGHHNYYNCLNHCFVVSVQLNIIYYRKIKSNVMYSVLELV